MRTHPVVVSAKQFTELRKVADSDPSDIVAAVKEILGPDFPGDFMLGDSISLTVRELANDDPRPA
jgi:hypothetical protein